MWRKFALGAIAALTLSLAPAAGAATVPISIGKTAYSPNPAVATTADTVQFTNADTAPHTVSFKTTTGVTCSPTPFVLQPAQTGTCTFTAAGAFVYSDPTVTSMQGTLTLSEPAAPDTLSLSTRPDDVVYASRLTLTGVLSSKKAGIDVTVLATPCGRSTPTKAATVQTTAGGEYSVGVRTARNTIYTVQTGATKSSEANVKVRPRLRLGRTGAHHYSLRVFAAQRFAGHWATLQRFNGIRWIFVKRVRLHSNSTHILPTVVSSVAFRATIAPRARLRATLAQLQAGACYLPGTSNVIRS